MDEIDKIEITIDEAKKIIAKCTHPDYSNEEHELFKAAAAKLLEDKDPGFEYEYESEEEEVKESRLEKEMSTGIKEGGKAVKKSLRENIAQYAGELFSNIQNLGAAGSVAFSSATYFQSVEMIETSQEVVSIVETIESDYGQTLNSYMFELAGAFAENIPYVGETNFAQNIAAALTEISENAETPQEREERRAAEKEAESTEEAIEESTEEATEESTEEATEESTEESTEEAIEESTEEATEESTEEATEESTEEATEESTEESEATEESNSDETTEEVESDKQDGNNNENEPGEESKNEESSIEADSSETKPNGQTDSLQGEANDSGNIESSTDSIDDIDPIKPHSMVGDDASDLPKVVTPNDTVVVSPNGPKND